MKKNKNRERGKYIHWKRNLSITTDLTCTVAFIRNSELFTQTRTSVLVESCGRETQEGNGLPEILSYMAILKTSCVDCQKKPSDFPIVFYYSF